MRVAKRGDREEVVDYLRNLVDSWRNTERREGSDCARSRRGKRIVIMLMLGIPWVKNRGHWLYKFGTQVTVLSKE